MCRNFTANDCFDAFLEGNFDPIFQYSVLSVTQTQPGRMCIDSSAASASILSKISTERLQRSWNTTQSFHNRFRRFNSVYAASNEQDFVLVGSEVSNQDIGANYVHKNPIVKCADVPAINMKRNKKHHAHTKVQFFVLLFSLLLIYPLIVGYDERCIRSF
jgi:hypothetical protein